MPWIPAESDRLEKLERHRFLLGNRGVFLDTCRKGPDHNRRGVKEWHLLRSLVNQLRQTRLYELVKGLIEIQFYSDQ